MLIKTDAVVLKQSKFGEGDRIITLFTKKLGKVQAVSKASGRHKGKYAVGTQLFSYGEFVLFKGRDLFQITQVDLRHSFYSIREDVTKLAYGAYLLELTLAAIGEGQTNNRLFELLINSLQIFSKSKKNMETIIKAYEMKLLYYSGYKPELECCVHCGTSEIGNPRFSSAEGGILCRNCFQQDLYAMKISPVTIRVMQYLITQELEQIAKLMIRTEVMEELNKITRHYIGTHLEKNAFKSLEFLNHIK
ncbi:DNA repair protein RecO [Geosporobacter ferrireducens]|uniref:DNA repair protein RecO n=1 Tax=Geosporobacter ferrireducens TaxID=1424294 RepID=A0A1D8GC67_9FIRM|nr:DNA repair protein RecO [Geosporobacter ferrireducens]AOT68514.1 DNA repair protein RecO [Geosporobacter ferrireducens]MTI53975.1 DNA repair protein RecO [Geosporobacter ferrireducens]